MKFIRVPIILISLVAFITNCTPSYTSNFRDQLIDINHQSLLIEPTQDTVFFNIDSLRTKCKRSDNFTFCQKANLLMELPISDYNRLFSNIKISRCVLIKKSSKFQLENTVSSIDSIKTSDNIGCVYGEYIEMDSLFLFTISTFEVKYPEQFVILVLNKQTGQLLNSISDDFFFYTSDNKFHWTNSDELIDDVTLYDGEESKDGAWEDEVTTNFQVRYTFRNSGEIQEYLQYVKQREYHTR